MHETGLTDHDENNFRASAPESAAAGPVTMTSPSESQSAIGAFADASRKAEQYYRALEQEVRRLAAELDIKKHELKRKIVEGEKMQSVLLSTLQSLDCGVLAVASDGIVVIANPAACRIFERPVEELAGRSLASVLPEAEGRERILDTLLGQSEHDQVSAEWVDERHGHARRIVRLEAVRALLPYDEHVAGLVLAEDVTGLRRLERREMVQNRLTGIGDMAVNLAHEIRNPLGSISLYATTLAHELASDPSLGPLAKNLVKGVGTVEHVVTNALEFARPRRLAVGRVDLAELIGDVLSFIEHPREQKQIALDLDLPGTEGQRGAAEASVAGDAEQLRQVLLNLMLNAIQAMDEGGSLGVSLRRDAAPGWLVEVADTGVGIDFQDLERIFDPYYSTKSKGSGIGLSVVHRVLSAHGAQIEVESKPGRGSKFRILFPDQTLLNEDQPQ